MCDSIHQRLSSPGTQLAHFCPYPSAPFVGLNKCRSQSAVHVYKSNLRPRKLITTHSYMVCALSLKSIWLGAVYSLFSGGYMWGHSLLRENGSENGAEKQAELRNIFAHVNSIKSRIMPLKNILRADFGIYVAQPSHWGLLVPSQSLEIFKSAPKIIKSFQARIKNGFFGISGKMIER